MLWKRVTSVNPLQHCRSSAYAGYHTTILWSSARMCLCLTIQLYSLCHSQQQEMYTTYQGSCIQNKLVTIDINYHKSGASIGVVYICTLLLLCPKQCQLKSSLGYTQVLVLCIYIHYCICVQNNVISKTLSGYTTVVLTTTVLNIWTL